MMMLRKGQRFRCQNKECGAEIEVTKNSIEGESGVTCCCGGVMKARYSKPVVKTVNMDRAILAKHFGQGT
jgi:hypothetical protein